MRVLISSDKAGFELKDFIYQQLKNSDHEIEDLGPQNGNDLVSFVEQADQLCQKILVGDVERGILICGTGMGMSLAANKHKGIYAAAVESIYSTRMCRLINNANVLCLGGFIVGKRLAVEMVNVFLSTDFLQDFEEWRKKFLIEQSNVLNEVENKNFK